MILASSLGRGIVLATLTVSDGRDFAPAKLATDFGSLGRKEDGFISPLIGLSSPEESNFLYVGVSSSSSDIMITSIDRFEPHSTAAIFRAGCFGGARNRVPAGAMALARRPPVRRADCGLKGDDAGTSIMERGDDAVDVAAGFNVVRSTI